MTKKKIEVGFGDRGSSRDRSGEGLFRGLGHPWWGKGRSVGRCHGSCTAGAWRVEGVPWGLKVQCYRESELGGGKKDEPGGERRGRPGSKS